MSIASGPPRAATWLGYAGILPQLALLALGGAGWPSGMAGLVYAGLILSFLGGLWWGQGMAVGGSPGWLFGVAVGPSLVAWAAVLAALWRPGLTGAALLGLGGCLLVSPLVDRAIGLAASRWLRLRRNLSVGLGGCTLALGWLVLRAGGGA